MKTVKQKIEEQKKKLDIKFPELTINQMHLGSGNHPNFKLWKETVLKVGYSTLDKWTKLKYILDSLNSINNSKQKIDYTLKEFKMYNLAKLLRKELSN